MHKLIVITGPTGSGKSALAVETALQYGCDVISADSRQIYKGLPITTAVPTVEERQGVVHHFLETLPLDAYYSAAQFETDVLSLLERLFRQNPVQVMCGGSMMYVDAVMRGIDSLPTISATVREKCARLFADEGLDGMLARLRVLDPEYYDTVDRKNHKRVVHAVEICMEAAVPYSTLRTGAAAIRGFDIEARYINMPREQLFSRINSRVETMWDAGMLEEVRKVADLRHLNSLNTVGVKEMLKVIDGEWTPGFALARLQKNTRVYAKKQLTWLKTRPEIRSI